jgi:hypothetical protein
MLRLLKRAGFVMTMPWIVGASVAASVVLAASTAQAARRLPIPASKLVPRRQDLPGFGSATVRLFSSMRVAQWVSLLPGETSAEVHEEVLHLRSLGFVEGVTADFRSPNHEAVAYAVVFRSARAATEQVAYVEAEDEKDFEKAGLEKYGPPAIPGSVGLGNFTPGAPAATGNVLFSTGRCSFVIGDRIVGATSRATGELPSTTAAKALYKRAKGLCK